WRALEHLWGTARTAVLARAVPALWGGPAGRLHFAAFDRTLGQQPGHNVHDPGGYLERLAGEADPGERLKALSVVATGLVEIGARLVSEDHCLGIKGINQPRRDPRFLPSFIVRFVHESADVAMGMNKRKRPTRQNSNRHRIRCPGLGQADQAIMSGMMRLASCCISSFKVSLRFFILASSSWSQLPVWPSISIS